VRIARRRGVEEDRFAWLAARFQDGKAGPVTAGSARRGTRVLAINLMLISVSTRNPLSGSLAMKGAKHLRKRIEVVGRQL